MYKYPGQKILAKYWLPLQANKKKKFDFFILDMFTEWWGARLQCNMGYVSIAVERSQSRGLHLLSTF